MSLKQVSDQVAVVMGASSGIGREVAFRFAERGARVIVAARGEAGLQSLVDEIRHGGGDAEYVVCDVSDPDQVEAVATAAVRTHGRIDTWVNVAAVSVYATFEETSLEEFARVMDVNFMGQVHGIKAALPHLRREGRGAVICISSIEGLTSLPLHSAYAASKHALEGALDALRRELMAEGVPISITSVKPGTINTPFFNKSRSKMDVKPKGPPPVYQPAVVADCVLYAAEHPVRELFAGGAGKMMALHQALAPGALDATLARTGISAQQTDEPTPGGTSGNLYEPFEHDDRIEGDFSDDARRFSLYTWLETHPGARTLALGGLLAGAAVWLARRDENGALRDRPYQRTERVPRDIRRRPYPSLPRAPAHAEW